jgi:hypothetical protein
VLITEVLMWPLIRPRMQLTTAAVISASLALSTWAHAASDREFIAELYAFSGQSVDAPCDHLPGVYDAALMGSIARMC